MTPVEDNQPLQVVTQVCARLCARANPFPAHCSCLGKGVGVGGCITMATAGPRDQGGRGRRAPDSFQHVCIETSRLKDAEITDPRSPPSTRHRARTGD